MQGDFLQFLIKLVEMVNSADRVTNVENKRHFVVKTIKRLFVFSLCNLYLKLLPIKY